MIRRIIVIGEPIAKKRPRAVSIGGHARVYSPIENAKYEKLVGKAYKDAYGSEMFGNVPLKVTIDFYLPIAKSISKKTHLGILSGEIKHIKKPDADNLAKCVLDGLNAVAFPDDSQIITLVVNKHYGEEPLASITISDEI